MIFSSGLLKKRKKAKLAPPTKEKDHTKSTTEVVKEVVTSPETPLVAAATVVGVVAAVAVSS